jgi:hypothetical protein
MIFSFSFLFLVAGCEIEQYAVNTDDDYLRTQEDVQQLVHHLQSLSEGNDISNRTDDSVISTTYDDEGNPIIHLANYTDSYFSNSWVAMSGDLRVPAVLAFGKGEVTLESLTNQPGVDGWTEIVSNVIDSVRELSLEQPPLYNEPDSILARVVRPCGGEDVAPDDPNHVDPQPCGPVVYGGEDEGCLEEVLSYGTLLASEWGQNCPYNSWTPQSSCMDMCSSDRTLTGCVATTGAQIAYYHAKPFWHNTPAFDLDYSAMLPRYVRNTTDITVAQSDGNVGFQMQIAGTLVDMDYGCGESGAQTKKLRDFFQFLGYDNKGSYDDFDFNTYALEMHDDMPVVLRGRTDKGGHAWVSDAYRVQTFTSCRNSKFMHMNWGWEGSNDGWFIKIDWSPNSFFSFNNSKKMIHGIRP